MSNTRFKNYNKVESYNGQALTLDQLRQEVPSIFAPSAHASRSAKYVYVPTEQIVTKMVSENFLPVLACQSRPRLQDRVNHAKHMIRFRKGGAPIGQQEVPEVILVNSHDGSSSYSMMAGIFRFVCANGMIAGDKFESIKVHHTGNIIDGILEGAFTVAKDFERALGTVGQMKEITLTPDEQGIFAAQAADLRFEPEEGKAPPLIPIRLLDIRRPQDGGNDLWSVFNRVQENALRGGQTQKTWENGRRHRKTTREVRGIDSNVRLNRALWTLAEKMAELKKAS